MRCERCNKDFPSSYYFKTDTICISCFDGLDPEERKKAIRSSLMKYPLTSTTHRLEGYRVVKHLGVVRGITVRSRSIFGRLGADLQTLMSGMNSGSGGAPIPEPATMGLLAVGALALIRRRRRA